jgi:hypothetical protein
MTVTFEEADRLHSQTMALQIVPVTVLRWRRTAPSEPLPETGNEVRRQTAGIRLMTSTSSVDGEQGERRAVRDRIGQQAEYLVRATVESLR